MGPSTSADTILDAHVGCLEYQNIALGRTVTLVGARRLLDMTGETDDKYGDIWLFFPKITPTCA